MGGQALQEYAEAEIPTEPGIYCFRYKVASLRLVSLRGNSGFSSDEITRASNKLVRRLSEIDEVISSRRYTGQINERGKSASTGIRMDSLVSQLPTLNLGNVQDEILAMDDPLLLVQLLEAASHVVPPLYVGITASQTLSQRYQQHKQDFSVRRGGTFGGRLSRSGLRWIDVGFEAITLPAGLVDEGAMLMCERILHSLTKPVFSER